MRTLTLNVFDMEVAPQNVLTTVPKRLGGGSWNLVTFNINLWSIRKSYFWFPGLSRVTMDEFVKGYLRFSEVIVPYVSL